MKRIEVAEARAFDSWLDYQEALKRGIAPLTEQQLNKRLVPGRRTPGEIAEHIVFGRALHLHRTLGEEVNELKPLLTWDDADDPPRTAEEILKGLDQTWHVIVNQLKRDSSNDEVNEEQTRVLQNIWGLLDHDLPHAGQLSMLLRADGLPGVGP